MYDFIAFPIPINQNETLIYFASYELRDASCEYNKIKPNKKWDENDKTKFIKESFFYDP